MIRFSEKSLIIEIECKGNELPLHVYNQLQEGLINMIEVIDHENGTPESIAWGLLNLTRLMQAMKFEKGLTLGSYDSEKLNEAIKNCINDPIKIKKIA